MDPIHPHTEEEQVEVCYRHPDRPTGVSCQRCGRKICSECMNQASVGVHCPECVQGAPQKVYTPRTMPGSAGRVTKVLVAINVAVWVGLILTTSATPQDPATVFRDYGTWGPEIDLDQEWWRIISGGFIHANLIHIGFNMYLLWQLGQQMERVIGEVNFTIMYFTALIGGSFGAMLLDPAGAHGGASGAVFGLFGATALLYRSRGIRLFDTGLGMVIVLNLVLTLGVRGISVGGHFGGFATGLVLGVVYFGLHPGDGPVFGRNAKAARIAALSLALVLAVGAIVAAGRWRSELSQPGAGFEPAAQVDEVTFPDLLQE